MKRLTRDGVVMTPRPWPLAVGIATWVLLLAATPAMFACVEGNQLDQGEVVEKSYDDPDHGSELYCAYYGKYGCSMWLNRDTYDGPHWSLRVVGLDEDGKERREWHEVTETLYEQADVGVTVNFPEDRVVPR